MEQSLLVTEIPPLQPNGLNTRKTSGFNSSASLQVALKSETYLGEGCSGSGVAQVQDKWYYQGTRSCLDS